MRISFFEARAQLPGDAKGKGTPSCFTLLFLLIRVGDYQEVFSCPQTPQDFFVYQMFTIYPFIGEFLDRFHYNNYAYCLSSENVMLEVFKQAWSIRLNICGSQKRRLKR